MRERLRVTLSDTRLLDQCVSRTTHGKASAAGSIRDSLILAQVEQVPVARDDEFGSGGEHTGEQVIIIWIGKVTALVAISV